MVSLAVTKHSMNSFDSAKNSFNSNKNYKFMTDLLFLHVNLIAIIFFIFQDSTSAKSTATNSISVSSVRDNIRSKKKNNKEEK